MPDLPRQHGDLPPVMRIMGDEIPDEPCDIRPESLDAPVGF